MSPIFLANLRSRLLALVLLAIVPTVGLAIYANVEQRRAAAAEVEKNTLRLAGLAADGEERLIEGTHHLLVALAHLPQVRENLPSACNTLFADLLKQYPLYINLSAITPDGEVFCSGLPVTGLVNVAHLPFFQRTLETQSFTPGEYRVGRISGQATLPFCYPVLDETDHIQAVVCAGLNLAQLSEVVANSQLPAGATFTMLDRHGTILARQPNPEQWVGQPLPEASLMQAILRRTFGTAEVAGADGLTRLYAFTPLLGLNQVKRPGTPKTEPEAYVVVGIPTEVAFAEINQTLVYQLMGLGLLGLFVLAAAWLGGEVFILRPVTALVRATQRLRAGDLNARTGLAYGAGELSVLARVFDEMAAELQQHENEREQAEEALRESEQRYSSIFDKSPFALALTKMPERTAVGVNDAFLKLFEYTLEEVVGKTSVDLGISDPEAQAQIAAQLQAAGSVRDFECTRITKSGTRLGLALNLDWLSIGGEKYILTTIRDITDRKRAEEALRHNEALLRQILDTNPNIIFVKDRQANIILANHALADSYQMTVDDLVGCSHQALQTQAGMSLAELQQWLMDDLEVIETGTPKILIEPYTHRDGSLHWNYTQKFPLDLADNSRGVLVISEDITRRKQAEESLKQTVTDLARSNAELEQFAYVASHDLQEPLRAVASTIQILQKRYTGQLDARADELIKHAVEGVTRMQTLISDLLAFSRVGTRGQSFQPTDCAEVLTNVLANLAVAMRESEAAITHDPLPIVMADRTQLIQLFQNLIANAIKFRGNEVPAIHIGVEQKDSEWLFAVRDNGIGIEGQYFERIFVVFQRLHTRREYAGTGIGLALCKKIVERHGGRIGVESEPGQGSTFYFTLPRMEP